jgi:beta-phosphoglucomutase
MIDTVLFEFDGVLADTVDARRDALTTALHAEGVSLSDAEYREHCAGLSMEDATRAVLALRGVEPDETTVALVVARGERAFRAYVGKGLTLTDGAREAVERLHAVARLGIVSRVGREEIAMALSLARLDALFACVIGAEDAFPPKPSPAPYRTALARLTKLRPVRPGAMVVAIEDSLPGIRSARGAGIRAVAMGDVPAHVALEADAYLPAMRGLSAAALEAVVTGSAERRR